MVLAITAEHAWEVGLLVLAVGSLLVGAVIARALGSAENGIFRVVTPLFSVGLLLCFAVFVYLARVHGKG